MPFEALQGQRLLDVQFYEPWGGRVPDHFAQEGPPPLFGALVMLFEQDALLCSSPLRYLLHPQGTFYGLPTGEMVSLGFRATVCSREDVETRLPATCGLPAGIDFWQAVRKKALPILRTRLELATVVASNADENAAWAMHFQFDSGHAYQLTFRHGLDGAIELAPPGQHFQLSEIIVESPFDPFGWLHPAAHCPCIYNEQQLRSATLTDWPYPLWDLVNPALASSVPERLQEIKQSLEEMNEQVLNTKLHGKFVKKLKDMKPEVASVVFDELAAWFPEDAVDLQYKRDESSSFQSLQQASAGQKTAAILSFLLAHGSEPLLMDQPEDDLDNALVSQLVVTQLRNNKNRRQLIVITHNANIVVNGDAELVMPMEFVGGQIVNNTPGGLQERSVRKKVCEIMEGGEKAFEQRYKRILKDMERTA